MFFLRYYADFQDDEGPRQPAFDTDMFPAYDLEELRKTCELAAEEHPDLTYLILDEDLRLIDVFGRLLREQWEAIDPSQVYEQARATGEPPRSLPKDLPDYSLFEDLDFF